jgi:hypothetical protein
MMSKTSTDHEGSFLSMDNDTHEDMTLTAMFLVSWWGGWQEGGGHITK